MSKKLYIYEDVDKLTEHWHNAGGLIIVTTGDPSAAWQARNARIAAEGPSNRTQIDPAYIIQELPEPDHVIAVGDDAPDLILEFPDRGCC